MKYFSKILFLYLLISTYVIQAQIDTSYSKFLIFKSQSIDYFPVWGKTENEIYINLASKEWRKFDLQKCNYIDGTYNEYPLAINTANNWEVVSDNILTEKLEKDKNWAPYEIINKKEIRFLLELNGFSSQLSFINTDGQKNKIMDIKGNAHSMSISPGGKYLACILELSGLIIFDIEKEIRRVNKKESLNDLSNLEKAKQYFFEGDFQRMKNIILKCTEDEKLTNSYHYYAGLIHFVHADSTKDTVAASKAIEHFLKVQDDVRFYDANMILSMMYHLKKDWENKLKFANKTILLMPNQPAGYYMRAEYYLFIGDKIKACEYFREAKAFGAEITTEIQDTCQ
jgi:hypothetical protein